MVNQHPLDLDVVRSDVAAFQRTLHSLFSLFAQRVFHNSFVFKPFRTLSKEHGGVFRRSDIPAASGPIHFFFSALRTFLHFFALAQNSTLLFSVVSALFT
jgi:hypothetical protein